MHALAGLSAVSRFVRRAACLVLLVALMTAPAAGAAPSHPFEGSLDTSFDPGTGADASVQAIALQADGKVIIAGSFTHYNEVARNKIARLNADGSLDTSFDPGYGIGPDFRLYAVAIQPNGKILIAGAFATYNGTARNNIARINPDGSLDTTFNPGTGAKGDVYAVVRQPDDKILIGGWFSLYNGTARNNIARLNVDGSLDTTFNPGSGPDNRVHSIARQPDGKVLIGGYFNNFNGQVRHHIARLNTNGSLDTTFNPGEVTNEWAIVYSIIVQPDGRLIFGGNFDQYNGIARSGIARANANGSLDASFDPGEGVNNPLYAMARQTNGNIVIGGAFQGYNRADRSYIARVHATGSLDTSFDPGVGADDSIDAIVLQPDGKILIGGDFTTYDNTPRSRITRVNSFGYYIFLPGIQKSY